MHAEDREIWLVNRGAELPTNSIRGQEVLIVGPRARRGGAIPEAEYLEAVRQAGFSELLVVAHHPFSPDELQAMARCPGEAFTPAPSTDDLAAVQGKVTSIKFTALKPLASAGE